MTPGTGAPEMVADTAPHELWPSTMSTLAPRTRAPNSRDPVISVVTMLPATRVTKMSPKLIIHTGEEEGLEGAAKGTDEEGGVGCVTAHCSPLVEDDLHGHTRVGA